MQIILSLITLQISVLILINFLGFIFFELVPLFFGYRNTIAKNFNDLIIFQFGMSIFSILFGIVIFIIFNFLHLNSGVIDLTNLNIFVQVFIVYMCAEFLIYISHYSAHKFKIPLVSKSHYFHHTVTEDIQWVNSKKEHPFIIFLFILVFCFVFYTLFRTDPIVKIIAVNIFIFLQALSHFQIPLKLKYLDWFFLLPNDHHKHHKNRTGPYGVSLVIYDTIFGTK